jgi:hypothetical protein
LILPVSRVFSLLSLAFLSLTTAPLLASGPTPPDLPDSPGAVVGMAGTSVFSDSNDGYAAQTSDSNALTQQSSTASEPVLLPRVKFVRAGMRAPKQHVPDKIALGLRESITPFSMFGWAASAGWSHLLDSAPNYGVNSEAFAQRLGAAAATGASKEIFSDAVFAPLFHQDPRYYQLGRSHKFIDRAVYAGTRPVIGQTDSGRHIFNYAGILGTGASAALTQAYYPDENVHPSQVMQNWATGIAGSALGYLISEFGGDVIQALHIEKRE